MAIESTIRKTNLWVLNGLGHFGVRKSNLEFFKNGMYIQYLLMPTKYPKQYLDLDFGTIGTLDPPLPIDTTTMHKSEWEGK